ncbi:hypothetical protein Emin_1501 [Elusimicrobium minutum Pei191]|uniref:Curli production assembly/transport component CsgG n=1 Tax=Elusimicrobium minutum (strain Pei191) TaxID=445932 RepID=B2KEV3_ELUMP|nr:CsgG/HfaB family protein [Elusimicrobium minutum]ACC99049.1 hypothetical protein Emin_1501 [Elusimicrobium minutum Pei191]
MKKILFSGIVSCLLLFGCATKTVISQDYDFKNVKRIGIMAFDSPWQSFTGAENLFAKYLLENGFTIIERAKIEQVLQEHNLSITGYLSPETTKMLGKILGVDLLLMGEITSYTPEKKTLTMVETRNYRTEPVFSTQMVKKPDGSVVATSRPSGQRVTNQREVTPTEYTISAQVGVIAKLVDVETAEVVWIGTDTAQDYSSLSAVDSIAKRLIKSFTKELEKQQKNARR